MYTLYSRTLTKTWRLSMIYYCGTLNTENVVVADHISTTYYICWSKTQDWAMWLKPKVWWTTECCWGNTSDQGSSSALDIRQEVSSKLSISYLRESPLFNIFLMGVSHVPSFCSVPFVLFWAKGTWNQDQKTKFIL